MKRSSPPTRTPAKLSESTHQRLNSYALAAGAAGVGVLALAQPAEAKIVYTPAHEIIGPDSKVKLDLNHDGKTDFLFFNSTNCDCCSCWQTLEAQGAAAGDALIAELRGQTHEASALRRGIRIGRNKSFHSYGFLAFVSGYATSCKYGSWCNVKNRYLGLKFNIEGKVHFGWARLSVSVHRGLITAELTGYAYQTIPGHGLRAGEIADGADHPTPNPASDTPKPTTLGTLAMGAHGLSIWRREEQAESTQ
jgi:hypothetical protein